jgi:hypothetical protein
MSYLRGVSGIITLITASLPAFAATGPILPPEPTIECEFFLAKPEEAAEATRWMRAQVLSVSGPDDAFLDYSPTDLALNEIGLPSPLPSGLVMSLDSKHANQNLYWVRLSDAGNELNAYPLHIPPILVWKLARRGDRQTEFDVSLETEDKSKLTFGSITRPKGANRIFISIGNAHKGFLTVTVGLDVDCDRFTEYTRAATPQFVLPHDVEKLDHLCRVGVIRAHFPIVPVKRPRVRGGGPGSSRLT